MIAGRKFWKSPATLVITSATNGFAPRTAVMFLSDVAKVRMRIAGTMAMKPLGIHSIASLNETSFLAQR